jgi:hypothetical protein
MHGLDIFGDQKPIPMSIRHFENLEKEMKNIMR